MPVLSTFQQLAKITDWIRRPSSHERENEFERSESIIETGITTALTGPPNGLTKNHRDSASTAPVQQQARLLIRTTSSLSFPASTFRLSNLLGACAAHSFRVTAQGFRD